MIKQGSTEVTKIEVGSQEISSVKIGEVEVFGGVKCKLLPLGTQWDIKQYYPNYQKLTADNFLFLHIESVSGSTRVKHSGGYTVYVNITGELVRSYDPSTGILQMYSDCNGTHGNVIPGMITDTSKLKYLGKGTSFNVSSYPNYKNFTLENFAIGPHSWWYLCRSSKSGAGDYRASGGFSGSRSYDASTGVFKFDLSGWVSGDTYKGTPSDYQVYFSEKPFAW